jgi:hypothetical protein
MSRIRIFMAVGLIAVGIGLAPWGRAAEPTTAKPAAPAETERERNLKQLLVDRNEEIDKLKSENERLKQEIRELKSRQPAILPPAPQLRLAPATPPAPKNATPRQFNGETYYLVPLISGNGTVIRGENQTNRPASKLPVTQPGR